MSRTGFGMSCKGTTICPAWNCGGRNSTYRHLGTTAPPIPQRPPQGAVYLLAHQRQAEQLPCWHWPTSRGNVLSAGKAAFRKRGRDGNAQSGKPNAVGTEDEQSAKRRYGNRIKRTYLSLILHKKGRRQQTVAFLISGVIWKLYYTHFAGAIQPFDTQ